MNDKDEDNDELSGLEYLDIDELSLKENDTNDDAEFIKSLWSSSKEYAEHVQSSIKNQIPTEHIQYYASKVPKNINEIKNTLPKQSSSFIENLYDYFVSISKSSTS